MKRLIPHIGGALLLIGLFFLAGGHVAHASFLGLDIKPLDLLNDFLAGLVNMALAAMAFLLGIAGAILSFSIVITLHIREFLEGTPAVYTVWKTIRDISGMFFIFFLLFASFKIILGFDSGFGKLIKDIVVAGILINFSFFIVGFLIDTSNIVSLAIYNQMIPAPSSSVVYKNTQLSDLVKQVSNVGGNQKAVGISDIFMQSLKIQRVYDSNGNKVGSDIQDPLKIVLIGVVGIIMMAMTAMSFIIASAAFIVRLVILIFLLAFSPLWVAGMVIPQLKEHVGKFRSMLTNQLLFMPIYLLLMYAALSILNGSVFNNNLTAASGASGGTGSAWIFSYLVLGIQFALVIVMLNLPLMVGLSMAGTVNGWVSKFGGEKMWKTIGGWTGSKIKENAWRGTGGRLASTIARSETLKNFAANSAIGAGLYKGIAKGAGSYERKLGEQVEARSKFAASLGYDQAAVNRQTINIRNLRAQAAAIPAANTAAKAAAEQAVRNAEDQLTALKNQRKEAYATRLGTRTGGVLGSADTLFIKIARKDKKGAAKIHIDVWEDQLKDAKDNLSGIKTDLKNLQNQINAQNAAGTPTSAQQQTQLTQLQTDRTRYQTLVDNLSDQIATAKLVK